MERHALDQLTPGTGQVTFAQASRVARCHTCSNSSAVIAVAENSGSSLSSSDGWRQHLAEPCGTSGCRAIGVIEPTVPVDLHLAGLQARLDLAIKDHGLSGKVVMPEHLLVARHQLDPELTIRPVR